jgi:hypothetical protein
VDESLEPDVLDVEESEEPSEAADEFPEAEESVSTAGTCGPPTDEKALRLATEWAEILVAGASVTLSETPIPAGPIPHRPRRP